MKEFALKLVNFNDLSFDSKEEALREITIMTSFKHPFILQFHSFFFHDFPQKTGGQMNYLVMVLDLCKGSLDKEHKKYSSDQKYDFIMQLCIALHHLHNKKYIHRDVKPANQLIGVDGISKLSDFGLSKLCQNFTRSKVGTPVCLAPEIIAGSQYDQRTDVWATGITAYFLQTGQYPFMGGTRPEINRKISNIFYDESAMKGSKLEIFTKAFFKQQDKRPFFADFLKQNKDDVLRMLKDASHIIFTDFPDLFNTMAVQNQKLNASQMDVWLQQNKNK